MDAFLDDDVKIIVNQGGTRSGKTYSILQYLVTLAAAKHQPRRAFSVVSLSLPHLKKGAIRDFAKILQEANIWDDKAWNRTDKI